VVEIRDTIELRELGLAGQRGSIAVIRRYEDGRHRYSLGSEDDEVGGLYDEDDLRPTGEQADISLYRVPGPFREREVVTISSDYPDSEIAGREAVIDGSYMDDEEELLLGVWLDELSQAFVVPPGALTSTGRRRPPEPLGRSSTSSRVSPEGEVVGTETYVIVDEINQYL
jgi:hypothetical protein